MSAALFCNVVFGSGQPKSGSGTGAKTSPQSIKKLLNGKLLETPAAKAAASKVADFIKSRPLGECIELRLIQSQKTLQILIDELFDTEKIRARIEKIMPSVQEKMKKAGADRSGLEKDPEVQEAMKLYLETEKIGNQQQELLTTAVYLLLEVVALVNRNAFILPQPGEFIRSEDADNNNHILLDVLELYTHCIRQVHAEMMVIKAENAKEVSDDKASSDKKAADNKFGKKQQLSSQTQKSSGAIKSKP